MSSSSSYIYLQPLDNTDNNFKRKLSKREKKEQKKKEKLQKLNPNADDTENHVAEKLYTGKFHHDDDKSNHAQCNNIFYHIFTL